MNTKNNKRAQATREKLQQVFVQLMLEKEPGKVTVQEICRRAGINRTTFYAHYADAYALMESIEQAMGEKTRDILYNGENGRLIADRAFEGLFTFVLENADYYRAYLKGGGRHIVDATPPYKSMEQAMELAQAAGIRSKIEHQYRSDFFNAGLNAIICRWLENGCAETPLELSGFIYREYHPNVSMLMERGHL